MITLPPLHPGEVLQEEFMQPMGLSVMDVARKSGIPADYLEGVIKEHLPLLSSHCKSLALCFSTTEQFWLNLQSEFDRRTEIATNR